LSEREKEKGTYLKFNRVNLQQSLSRENAVCYLFVEILTLMRDCASFNKNYMEHLHFFAAHSSAVESI